MTVESTLNKIVNRNQFITIINEWKQKGLKIVFSNGCFDILHPGHIEYLEEARKLGDRLVLGLNSDISVRHIKGNNRPIIVEEGRARILAALQFVDLITLFDEDTPQQLISDTLPDVLIKGNDYQINQIAGADTVIKNGGTVETIPLVEGYSTSSLINKISKTIK